ncbi:PadR family transcriptional regulator [Kribbella deserti]|uniref:PadR family transcriptional regulator n=1 Tax=Kribbella deserti TaxID=1926257 RepID=A0ABV6QVR3_9ACTN
MSTTRLLLLGVVRIFQPAYGYQLRRELLTWNVQVWANINPGSIYSGLRTLAKHGYLAEIQTTESDDRPGRTSYKLTAEGESEYFILLREALWNVAPFRPDRMQAALSFLWSLKRDEVIAGLESRTMQLEQLDKQQRFAERGVLEDAAIPDHVVEMLRISSARDLGELQWTREFLQRVRDGEYSFAGEPRKWQPPADLVTHWGSDQVPPEWQPDN